MSLLPDALAIHFRSRDYYTRHWQALLQGYHEPELRLLPALVSPGELALDVGANQGLYSAHLLHLGARVIAFEPLPELGSGVRRIARKFGLPLDWRTCVLSEHPGTLSLRVPLEDQGLSSVEPSNTLKFTNTTGLITRRCPAFRLDDLQLSHVGLIKIDVEGHELSVLRGSLETISRQRCSMIIECENRHSSGAVENLFSLLYPLSYRAFFVDGTFLRPATELDISYHQNPAFAGDSHRGWKHAGLYINNFLLLPAENVDELLPRLASLLSA